MKILFFILFYFLSFFYCDLSFTRENYDKGLVLYNSSEYDSALTFFQKSLELNEDVPVDIYLYLGNIYNDKKNFEEAVRYYKIGLSKNITLVYKEIILYNLARTYFSMSLYKEALEIYNELEKIKLENKKSNETTNPNSISSSLADIFYDRGIIYFKLNNIDFLISTWEYFIKNFPNDSRYVKVVKALEFLKKKMQKDNAVIAAPIPVPSIQNNSTGLTNNGSGSSGNIERSNDVPDKGGIDTGKADKVGINGSRDSRNDLNRNNGNIGKTGTIGEGSKGIDEGLKQGVGSPDKGLINNGSGNSGNIERSNDVPDKGGIDTGKADKVGINGSRDSRNDLNRNNGNIGKTGTIGEGSKGIDEGLKQGVGSPDKGLINNGSGSSGNIERSNDVPDKGGIDTGKADKVGINGSRDSRNDLNRNNGNIGKTGTIGEGSKGIDEGLKQGVGSPDKGLINNGSGNSGNIERSNDVPDKGGIDTGKADKVGINGSRDSRNDLNRNNGNIGKTGTIGEGSKGIDEGLKQGVGSPDKGLINNGSGSSGNIERSNDVPDKGGIDTGKADKVGINISDSNLEYQFNINNPSGNYKEIDIYDEIEE